MADSLEQLPFHFRRLADQIGSDPADPSLALSNQLRNTLTTLSRLGTAASTFGNTTGYFFSLKKQAMKMLCHFGS